VPLKPPLDQIPWLHHFTDSRNLVFIKKLGGLYSMAKLREMCVTKHFPGGNEWSLDADSDCGMDQYVHLCFRTNHPMEHLAKNDGRIEKTSWLYIRPAVLEIKGALFCPGVSNKAGMTTHPLSEAATMIDYQVLYTRTNWGDPEIQGRLHQAELCEILIPDFVPFKYFSEYFPNG
jgi:hypothetical protein